MVNASRMWKCQCLCNCRTKMEVEDRRSTRMEIGVFSATILVCPSCYDDMETIKELVTV